MIFKYYPTIVSNIYKLTSNYGTAGSKEMRTRGLVHKKQIKGVFDCFRAMILVRNTLIVFQEVEILTFAK